MARGKQSKPQQSRAEQGKTQRARAMRQAGRDARKTKRRRFRRVRRYLIIAGLAVIIFLLILGLVLPGALPPAQQRADGPSAGGPGNIQPDLGRGHLAVGVGAPVNYYTTYPPTSGSHSPGWTNCGIHESPVPDEVLVHNLEHGFVNIQYNTEDEALVEELKTAAEDLPGWPDYYILTPYPNLDRDSPIALTAWRVIQYLDTVDAAAMEEFANAYRTFGPEVASGCAPGGFMQAQG